VKCLGSHLLAEGKGFLAIFPMGHLFWSTFLESQQAFGFPFQCTDELRASQRATGVSIPPNHDQLRFALPGIRWFSIRRKINATATA
jgi:hypothetical protein